MLEQIGNCQGTLEKIQASITTHRQTISEAASFFGPKVSYQSARLRDMYAGIEKSQQEERISRLSGRFNTLTKLQQEALEAIKYEREQLHDDLKEKRELKRLLRHTTVGSPDLVGMIPESDGEDSGYPVPNDTVTRMTESPQPVADEETPSQPAEQPRGRERWRGRQAAVANIKFAITAGGLAGLLLVGAGSYFGFDSVIAPALGRRPVATATAVASKPAAKPESKQQSLSAVQPTSYPIAYQSTLPDDDWYYKKIFKEQFGIDGGENLSSLTGSSQGEYMKWCIYRINNKTKLDRPVNPFSDEDLAYYHHCKENDPNFEAIIEAANRLLREEMNNNRDGFRVILYSQVDGSVIYESNDLMAHRDKNGKLIIRNNPDWYKVIDQWNPDPAFLNKPFKSSPNTGQEDTRGRV